MPTDERGSEAERPGFTLIEVLVALAVSAVILLAGRLTLQAVGDAATATTRTTREADSRANADHLLRTLVGRLEVGTDRSRRFGGDERSVHFTTWCDTPAGWLERCDAVLAVEQQDGAQALIAHLSPSDAGGNIGPSLIVLATGFQNGTIRYLDDARAGGRWFVRWGEAITAPLALEIILDEDTCIARIGERG